MLPEKCSRECTPEKMLLKRCSRECAPEKMLPKRCSRECAPKKPKFDLILEVHSVKEKPIKCSALRQGINPSARTLRNHFCKQTLPGAGSVAMHLSLSGVFYERRAAFVLSHTYNG